MKERRSKRRCVISSAGGSKNWQTAGDVGRSIHAATCAVIRGGLTGTSAIVSHLAEIATSQKTRMQLGGLIKREVDDYYRQLSFFKKSGLARGFTKS